MKTNETWRRLFEPCPGCKGNVTGHHYFMLASVFTDPDDGGRVEQLAALVKSRQWSQAATFQDFDGLRDFREYYLLRCPEFPQLALVIIQSLFEMFADDYTESRELLDSEASVHLAEIAADRWSKM